MLLELGIFGVKLMAGWFLAALALILYALCIWSYSIAVFTNPLSPIDAVPPPHTHPQTTYPPSYPNLSPSQPFSHPSPLLSSLSPLQSLTIGQRLLLPPPIHPHHRPLPAIQPNRQKRRPRTVLPEMQLHETRPHSPLQHLQKMYPQNGPPLSLAR